MPAAQGHHGRRRHYPTPVRHAPCTVKQTSGFVQFILFIVVLNAVITARPLVPRGIAIRPVVRRLQTGGEPVVWGIIDAGIKK